MSSLKQGTLFQQNVYLKNYIYSFGSWNVCNIVNARVTIALCLDIYFVSVKLLYYCFWFQIKTVVGQSLLLMSTTGFFFFFNNLLIHHCQSKWICETAEVVPIFILFKAQFPFCFLLYMCWFCSMNLHR